MERFHETESRCQACLDYAEARKKSDIIQRALQFLQDHNEIAFATCEGNQPKLRVFQIMKQESATLCFATSPEKQAYRELQANPNVELLASANKVSVRCSGIANFDMGDEMRRWIYNHNPVLHRLYTSYDKLVYFRLPIAEMDYYDLRPTPPIFKHFDLMTGEVSDGYVGERYGK